MENKEYRKFEKSDSSPGVSGAQSTSTVLTFLIVAPLAAYVTDHIFMDIVLDMKTNWIGRRMLYNTFGESINEVRYAADFLAGMVCGMVGAAEAYNRSEPQRPKER